MKFIPLIFVLSLISGCTSFTTINPGGCGSTPIDAVCLGKTTIPSEQEELFMKASNQAIDAVASQKFRDDLDNFVRQYSQMGKHSEAWQNVDVDSIPERLLQEVQGMEISTFGGLRGLFLKLFYGTNAFEGDGVGPILLNRWSLPRSSASIANTIVHEASHRIGLSHPSINKRKGRGIADCEPPYLIGSLIEKHILGSQWSSKGHCLHLSRDV